jgi:hypothetical protein
VIGLKDLQLTINDLKSLGILQELQEHRFLLLKIFWLRTGHHSSENLAYGNHSSTHLIRTPQMNYIPPIHESVHLLLNLILQTA